jgi:hypothetical protein
MSSANSRKNRIGEGRRTTMKAKLATVSILIAALALLVPTTVQAEAEAESEATVVTTEITDGTVIIVYGNNLVVEMSDGEIRDIDVPEGFEFDVEGKKVPLSELTRGSKLKATITTTTTPHVVKVTEIKGGVIVSVVGRNVTVRTDEGTKMYRDVPSDYQFEVNRRKYFVQQLLPGMKITATIVHEHVETETERDVKVKAKPPKN